MKEYIRVGTEYFKLIDYPLISGDSMKSIIKWNKQTIIDDFGKDSLQKIKKYESFCTFPSHILYQREINKFYNKYEPLSYPINQEGDWKTIEGFLEHIFGDQYDLGLDYLTILWQHPTQILPILCLVSTDRNTGKSTFLKFLKLIFEGNMTINKTDDFRSRFNSDWASKLIIAIDEVLLDKKEDNERLKNLSTANYHKSEGKGVDKVEIEFFGKFILFSNHEENFVKIDGLEIRYWVIKVVPFKLENPDLLEQMRKELPHFAFHLSNREIKTKRVSRMWFSKEQIYTKALDVLMRGNRTCIEKEIEEFLIDEFSLLGVDELCFSVTNLVEQLNKRNIRAKNTYVSKILREHFRLEPKNSTYKIYKLDYSSPSNENPIIYHDIARGRHYTFKKENFIKNC